MRRPIAAATCALLISLALAVPALAQTGSPPAGHPHAPAPTTGPPPPGAPGGGPHGHPMGGMMGGTMGGHRGGGLCGVLDMGDPADPRVMQMRGEMLKALGDILLRYGQQLEASPRPAPR